MLEQLIELDTTNKIKALRENQVFLDELLISLTNLYDAEVISTKRRGEFMIDVEFGKHGNYYARRNNLFFTLSHEKIRVSTSVYYTSLPQLGMKQVYLDGEYELLKDNSRDWLTAELKRDTACGNSYQLTFVLSKQDNELNNKLKYIIKLCEVNNIRLSINIDERLT